MGVLVDNSFALAFTALMEEEGGYSNLTADHGGATNFGISLRFLKLLPEDQADITGDGHVDIEDIRALSIDDAEHFYRWHFWDHYRLDQVLTHWPAVKLFGMFVNMRGRVAAAAAQRALLACGYHVSVDGILGSKSFRAINSANQRAYVAALRSEQAWIYRRIVERDDEQGIFLSGWLRRAYHSPV